MEEIPQQNGRKLLIDADGCPVVRQAAQLAQQYGFDCVLLCDTSHQFSIPGARTITVSKGRDSADFALVNLAGPGDVAITQDYGLAAMCLAKKAVVLNQNGLVYTQQNIGALLAERHQSMKDRRAGVHKKGPPKRTPQQDETFCQALRMLLQKVGGEYDFEKTGE